MRAIGTIYQTGSVPYLSIRICSGASRGLPRAPECRKSTENQGPDLFAHPPQGLNSDDLGNQLKNLPGIDDLWASCGCCDDSGSVKLRPLRGPSISSHLLHPETILACPVIPQTMHINMTAAVLMEVVARRVDEDDEDDFRDGLNPARLDWGRSPCEQRLVGGAERGAPDRVYTS